MRREDHGRRGFIYIVGWRVLNRKERKPAMLAKCPNCKVDEARLIGRVRRAWFTMFFIPILPLDPADRAQRISQCCECRQIFEMPIEQLARQAGAMAAADFSATIEVYNELRDQPNNGQIMLKLLKMYEALGERNEAESVARHFPAAMAAEPACAELLERMRGDTIV
jgi:hypothetical protein